MHVLYRALKLKREDNEIEEEEINAALKRVLILRKPFFLQTLDKMASGLKQVLTKMK
jgi:hypothetical protein